MKIKINALKNLEAENRSENNDNHSSDDDVNGNDNEEKNLLMFVHYETQKYLFRA